MIVMLEKKTNIINTLYQYFCINMVKCWWYFFIFNKLNLTLFKTFCRIFKDNKVLYFFNSEFVQPLYTFLNFCLLFISHNFVLTHLEMSRVIFLGIVLKNSRHTKNVGHNIGNVNSQKNIDILLTFFYKI